MRHRFVLFITAFLLFMGCGTIYPTLTYEDAERGADSLVIHEGIMSQHAQRIKYKKNGKTVAVIKLSEPVMVAMAEQEEKWGYFQFPNIGRAEDGTLVIGWTMKEDSHLSYGKSTARKATLMMSKDKGRTWQPQDKDYFAVMGSYKIHRSNGDILQVTNPASKDISAYKDFPSAVGLRKSTMYYPMEKLPEELQGVYFYHYDAVRKKAENIHSQLNAPSSLRYAIDGSMPVVWWGDIKEMADQSLVAGIYPDYYMTKEGKVSPGCVSFFKSTDEGYTWDLTGRIPFYISPEDKANEKNDNGFDEPSFEILRDSTFICVMRTGSAAPMYRSFSKDFGRTWTTPSPFTPNGVKPSLMLLKNGVLVLASGRPGIQLRFSFDGRGESWSDPVDMIPYMGSDGSYNTKVSCGYPAILEAGDDTFYLVYSDFTKTNEDGKTRKAIMCREIRVNKR